MINYNGEIVNFSKEVLNFLNTSENFVNLNRFASSTLNNYAKNNYTKTIQSLSLSENQINNIIKLSEIKNIKIMNLLNEVNLQKEIDKISSKNNFTVESNNKLLDEVTDIVEQPNIIVCKFDQKFLNIPKEILIITMQYHQKYLV